MNTVDVERVWELCFDVYKAYNITLRFPIATDKTKTYQWRFVKSLAQKFGEWDFSDETIVLFLHTALRRAKELGILKIKGLAIFHQGNLMSWCYDEIQERLDCNEKTIGSLAMAHQWFQSKTSECKDIVKELLRREEDNSLPNIVIWYQANKITSLYIALSKSCSKAVSRLQTYAVEKSLLPTQTKLYLMRQEFLKDLQAAYQAHEIFQDDWR